MKSFRVKSSENKSKTCENHVFSRVFTCTSLYVDQKFKYRGPPPIYAHILLTKPQKHLRLALLATMESFRAKSSENKSKNCEHHVFSCVFLVLRLSTLSTSPLLNPSENVPKSQKQHGLIRFSFAWKLFCNDLEVNRAPSDREIRLWKMSGRTPPFLLRVRYLTTQKHTRTLTGTPIFIFSLSPVNYTSETP